jgi:FkbM family methyltransferase
MLCQKRNLLNKFIKSNKLIYYLFFPLIYGRSIPQKYKNYKFNKLYNSLFDMVIEGSLVVNMPDFRGSFEIDYRSIILRMILKDKDYEPEHVRIIEKYINPSKDAIDVGANVGLFTILLSKIVSEKNKVLSIEPTPLALKYLHRNIKRNKSEKSVIIYEGISTNTKGDYKLNVIPGMEEYSSLGELVHPEITGKDYKQIDVNGDTIDNLVNLYNLVPGFIKVDTEGAEYLVLSGALNTIQKYKPIILSELQDRLLSSFGDNSEKIICLLRDNGYKIINAYNPRLPINLPFNGDILAIPDQG